MLVLIQQKCVCARSRSNLSCHEIWEYRCGINRRGGTASASSPPQTSAAEGAAAEGRHPVGTAVLLSFNCLSSPALALILKKVLWHNWQKIWSLHLKGLVPSRGSLSSCTLIKHLNVGCRLSLFFPFFFFLSYLPHCSRTLLYYTFDYYLHVVHCRWYIEVCLSICRCLCKNYS